MSQKQTSKDQDCSVTKDIQLIQATQEDLVYVVGLIESYRDGMECDIDIIVDNAIKMIDMDQVLLVYHDGKPIGCVSGVVAPCLFRKGMIFSVMFFYVKIGWRHLTKHILKELEMLLLPTNSSMITYGIPEESENSAEMERFFRIMGYKKLETHYYKRFDNVEEKKT